MIELPDDRPYLIIDQKAWNGWYVRDSSPDKRVKLSPHRLIARDRYATPSEAHMRAWAKTYIVLEQEEAPFWRYTIVKSRKRQ